MKKLIALALCAILSAAVLAAIPAFADAPAFTIEATEAKAGEGATYAAFDVWFKDVPDVGLCAVQFEVQVEGATFASADIGDDMPGSFMPGDTGKDSINFLWVDIAEGVYDDVLAASFTVKLPEGTKKGDEIPVKIVISDDPDNYLGMATDPATGDNYNVTPTAKDAKITIVAASEAPAEPSPSSDGEDGRVDVGTNDGDDDDGEAGDAATGGETAAKDTEREDAPGRVLVTGSVEVGASPASTGEAKDGADASGSSLTTAGKIAIIAGAVAAVGAAVAAVLVSKKSKKKD